MSQVFNFIGCFLPNTTRLWYDFYMNKVKILYSILAILFGVFMFVYGEIDDSPGGQMLGLIAVIIGVVGIIKNKKISDLNKF